MFQRLLDDILAPFFSIRLWSLLVLAVKWVTVLVSSATALIVCMLLIACYHERNTRSCLRSLATPRAVLPFLNQWIMIKYCSNPDSAGYGPLYFEVRRGYYEQFKKHGIYMLYSGLKPVVVVLRKDYVEAVLSSNTALDKGHQYSFLHSWLGTGLLTSGGTKWKARRRLIAPAFHLRILEDFTPIINSQSMLLRDILGRASRSSNGVDVVPKVNACTLNIICETIMGTAFNAQSNSESPYIKAVDRLLHLYVERLTKPFLWSEFIYKSSSRGREYKRWLDIANSFARKGHDTTSQGISWTLFLIGHHPEEQQKIHDELDLIFGDDQDRHVTNSDVKQMKYLECVIKVL